MKIIDTAKLKRGDIILSTSLERISGLIRRFTNSDISHAMMYVANGSVIDSTGEGVQARNIQKMHFHDECAMYVYRLKDEISELEMSRVINYVRSEVGAPYDKLGAGLSVLNPRDNGGKNQFCSRLVARAYAEVGIRITENPDYATPMQVKSSGLLYLVEDAVVTISSSESELLLMNEDTTKGMREVTIRLLDLLREISTKVRTLNDAVYVLQSKPGLDKKFLAAYKASGYLDYWELQEKRHPWRYNYEGMLSLRDKVGLDAVMDYCRDTIEGDMQGEFEHWNVSAQEFRKIYMHMRLKTFGQLAILYHNLNSSHRMRVEVAKRFLAEHLQAGE